MTDVFERCQRKEAQRLQTFKAGQGLNCIHNFSICFISVAEPKIIEKIEYYKNFDFFS